MNLYGAMLFYNLLTSYVDSFDLFLLFSYEIFGVILYLLEFQFDENLLSVKK